MAKRIPTQAEVRRLFTYDADRGVLVCRERPASDFEGGPRLSAVVLAKCWNTRYAGKIAGRLKNGYRNIRFTLGKDKFNCLGHRLIWLYVNGEWPDFIDHENGFEAGDRIGNLRSVTFRENMLNTRMGSRNTSGFVGVCWARSRWQAKIMINKKTLHLGCFINKEDAIAARIKANEKYGFHKNHGKARNPPSPSTA